MAWFKVSSSLFAGEWGACAPEFGMVQTGVTVDELFAEAIGVVSHSNSPSLMLATTHLHGILS
jgi:hypothetical protein